MNPYAILFCLVFAAGIFVSGVSVGKRWEEGRNAVEKQHITEAVEAANLEAAKAIAAIKVRHTTVQNEVRREIETNTVYRDCLLPDSGVRLINQAIAGSASNSELPKTDAPSK